MLGNTELNSVRHRLEQRTLPFIAGFLWVRLSCKLRCQFAFFFYYNPPPTRQSQSNQVVTRVNLIRIAWSTRTLAFKRTAHGGEWVHCCKVYRVGWRCTCVEAACACNCLLLARGGFWAVEAASSLDAGNVPGQRSWKAGAPRHCFTHRNNENTRDKGDRCVQC